MNSKVIVLLSILIIFTLSVIISKNEQSDSSNKYNYYNLNEPLPEIEVTTFSGERINLKNIQSDLVLVNFWASWCLPCIEEFPSLLQLVQKAEGKVSLVAISIDETKDQATTFLKKHNFIADPNVYFVFDDKKEISRNYFATEKVPETFFIKDGKIVKKIIGKIDWNINFVSPYLQKEIN